MPFVETNDGTRLNYLDGGAGKPVLFVASAWLSYENAAPGLFVTHAERLNADLLRFVEG